MLSSIVAFFDDTALLPHATCLSWRPDLLWLHAVSDVLTALAYYSIPVALTIFAIRRRDLQFRWIFVLFGVFILSCGTTHITSVWTLWDPAWGVAGLIKAVTAVASLATAALLWPLIPRALAIPGPDQWRAINKELQAEVAERRHNEAQVRSLNAELERRVRDRTSELAAANDRLKSINESLRAEITARTKVEMELRNAKATAERANVSKSKFLAAASHDLRQPVQSLMFFFAALERQFGDQPRIPHILEGMEQSLDGLRLLLDALLDVSKLDAGIVDPQPVELKLSELIDNLVSEYQPSAAERGVRLRGVSCSAIVHTDPALLQRILRNLLVNALRYTEAGGIVIGCRRNGAKVRVEVVDTGPGIPPEKHTDIFEEFYQIGNSERDRSQGLGLGLAIVRRLAGLLGLGLGVRSAVGKGSCFFIELDVVGWGWQSDSAPMVLPRTASGSVLVIEDEALVLASISAMLSSWGLDVVQADGADQALEKLAHIPAPDLIIADYRLRGGELGTEAASKIQSSLARRIPAVILTGDTNPERIKEVQSSQFELLHKPVTPAQIKALISKMIERA